MDPQVLRLVEQLVAKVLTETFQSLRFVGSSWSIRHDLPRELGLQNAPSHIYFQLLADEVFEFESSSPRNSGLEDVTL